MLITAAINATFISIATYTIMQLTIKRAKTQLVEEFKVAINDERFQKALFELGGLFASGAKSGLQLPTARGKGGIEGLIMGLIGNFIQNKIGIPGGQPQASNTPIEQ